MMKLKVFRTANNYLENYIIGKFKKDFQNCQGVFSHIFTEMMRHVKNIVGMENKLIR